MKKRFAFVAGSAHLDVIAEVTSHFETVDKIGTIRYEFGGTAYNMAVNLQAHGVQTVFTGAFNTSAMSQMILAEMASHGIRTHVKLSEGLPEAGFCAQLHQGDLFSAVSSMPVEQVKFSNTFLAKGVKNASCALLDCNLSPETLVQISSLAQDHSVPVYIAGVSEAKCVRILQVEAPVVAVFLNAAEMLFLLKTSGHASPQALADTTGRTFVVTNGSKSVEIVATGQATVKIPVQAEKIEGNALGAGDLFASMVAKYHGFDGLSLQEAVERAIKDAATALKHGHANMGRGRALDANLSTVASQAERDKLTKLLNRHGLERFIHARQAEKKGFFVIICDVDHFKNFNDTYGHETGDKVLQLVAQVMAHSVRGKDAVGRWGGEEFMAVVCDTNAEVAEQIAERIRRDVAALEIVGVERSITLSAGLAYASVGQTWEDAFQKADAALYEAKRGGRNRVVRG